jgi:hypothetical protein
MTTGWIMFVGLGAVGLVDLILGFVFSRTREPSVGAPPPVGGEDALRARRFAARAMMVGALLIWGVAIAGATGHLGHDLALPMFGGPVS